MMLHLPNGTKLEGTPAEIQAYLAQPEQKVATVFEGYSVRTCSRCKKFFATKTERDECTSCKISIGLHEKRDQNRKEKEAQKKTRICDTCNQEFRYVMPHTTTCHSCRSKKIWQDFREKKAQEDKPIEVVQPKSWEIEN